MLNSIMKKINHPPAQTGSVLYITLPPVKFIAEALMSPPLYLEML